MKNKLIRIAPILLIVVITILLIALIVTVSQHFFGGDTDKKEQKTEQQVKIDESEADLLKSDKDRGVRLTVRGPIVASENFHSYTVDITPEKRSLKTYKGYLDQVIDDSTLANNTKSYEELVHALNKANMMKGKQLVGEADDTRGVCAKGRIYDFAITKDGAPVKHLWTSTCKGSKGSLAANVPQLQDLFISQIPNNNKIVKDLGLSSF